MTANSSTRESSKLRSRISRLIRGKKHQKAPAHGQMLYADGGVMLADNFLPANDFRELQQWALGIECDLTRRDRNWGMEIILGFDECKCSRQWSSAEDDMPEQGRKFITALHKTGMIEADATIVLGVYRWQALSGMGEHSDGHTDTAITFYLNDTWKENWFGDFIFYESKEDAEAGFGRSVTPLANRLVINKSTVHHKVTYCSNLAVERISVQAFVLKDPK
jgi:hypothetical protein